MVDIGEDYGDEMTHDCSTLLFSDGRDFLIRNNGDQVKVSSLIGKKTIGIYKCWPEPLCSEFLTPILLQAYHEIGSDNFEVVLLMPSGEDQDSFDATFARMPWLAVPHWDSKAVWDRLSEWLWNMSARDLVIIDKTGKNISIPSAFTAIQYYGAEAYPFTRERISFLNDEDASAKRDQSLASILGDRLIRCATGQQISVSELVGKTVGLYQQPNNPNEPFTDTLIEVYNEIKNKGGEFEVVIIPHCRGEAEDFKKKTESMPWLALPFRTRQSLKFWYYFPDSLLSGHMGHPPYLFIIGPDGKNLNLKGSRLVTELGSEAFPFTPQKLDELQRAKEEEPWSLEKLLVFRGRDFLIAKDGSKVPVTELVGKTIMFYFYTDVIFPTTDQVIESCSEIKRKFGNEFEVILIGYSYGESDLDQGMLTFPSHDPREDRLSNYWFEVKLLPTAIVVGPNCEIVTREAVEFIGVHGADAYPFTEEHITWLDECAEERSHEWPEKMKLDVHEHELDRVLCDGFLCDGCYWSRNRWNFKCIHCGGFDLHNGYAFGNNNDLGRPNGREFMELLYSKIYKDHSCL